MENNIYSKVIMDSGKEYIFIKHPEDLLNRMTNPKTENPYEGFVHFVDVSINPSHISSIESLDIRKESIPLTTKVHR